MIPAENCGAKKTLPEADLKICTKLKFFLLSTSPLEQTLEAKYYTSLFNDPQVNSIVIPIAKSGEKIFFVHIWLNLKIFYIKTS